MPESFGNARESERREVATVRCSRASTLRGEPANMLRMGALVSRDMHLAPKCRKPVEVILLDVNSMMLCTATTIMLTPVGLLLPLGLVGKPAKGVP